MKEQSELVSAVILKICSNYEKEIFWQNSKIFKLGTLCLLFSVGILRRNFLLATHAKYVPGLNERAK